ncbi:dienelactone hydrolase family protein [Methyloparacoccus murrellii]
MSLVTRLVDYPHADTRCEGFLAFDDACPGPRPGILIAHTWAGRDDFAMDKARALAAEGYVALALDMYGEGRVGDSPEACAQLMGGLIKDRLMLQDRIRAALETLRRQPEADPQRLAAMGFCFGGLCVLDLARSGADLRGVVSFHGLFTPPEPSSTAPIKSRLLVLHGFEDPMATPEQAVELGRELTARGADWQLHLFGNSMHAFTNPRANDPAFGTVYDPLADRRAWRLLMDFLAEVLE